jgi:NosR/NirI family nitrous oxide reductase transcriptional regulator
MTQTVSIEAPPKRPGRRFGRHDWIRLGVVLGFVVCWLIGSARGHGDLDPFFRLAYPEASEVVKLADGVHEARAADASVIGYVAVGSASGYGGPLSLAVAVDLEGRASSLAVVDHRETPSFFERAIRAGMLRRLAGLGYEEPIVLGEDVDAVSGATYTSRALTQSLHRALREVAGTQLGLPLTPDEQQIVFGVPELILIALFAAAVLQRRIRVRKKLRGQLRWATRLTGLVSLGFVYNSPFVLAHINMVLLGYWPEWQTHLYWYVLIGGLLLFKASDEWNVYCYDFCPFGAAQDALGLIGAAKSRPVRWSGGLLWAKRWLIAAAIAIALLLRNPGVSSYEIFGTLFTLEGSNFQFALLALIVLASMFYARPWCQYLCPLHRHGAEGLFDWCRRQVLTSWRRIRPRPAA